MMPHAGLMRQYGTAPVLLEKNAGAASLIERVGMLLLNEGMLASSHADDEERAQEHEREYEGKREHAHEQLEPALKSLRHTDVPEDWNVRTAAARAVGVGLAKIAGLGSGLAGLALKHPGVVAGAGVLGVGALGAKAINSTVGALGQGPRGPATFGGGRFGRQLANGVNEYGQPQVGTPLL